MIIGHTIGLAWEIPIRYYCNQQDDNINYILNKFSANDDLEKNYADGFSIYNNSKTIDQELKNENICLAHQEPQNNSYIDSINNELINDPKTLNNIFCSTIAVLSHEGLVEPIVDYLTISMFTRIINQQTCSHNHHSIIYNMISSVPSTLGASYLTNLVEDQANSLSFIYEYKEWIEPVIAIAGTIAINYAIDSLTHSDHHHHH